ncbi:MAG: TorF family putative porin [Lautropia sp.]
MNPRAVAATLVLSAASALLPAVASAQSDPAASTLTANAAVVSDYRFRGVSQTFRKPALQGGVDYGHSSGLYVGSWASMVDKDFYADSAGIELDIYGGYKFPLGAGWTGDVGLLQYLYPGESLYNTLEAYIGASWNWFAIKYSHSLNDKFFGVPGARGSGYLDATLTYPLQEGLNLIAHIGRQNIAGDGNSGSYTDYRLGATYDWVGFTWGASVYSTSEDFEFSKPNGKTRKLGGTALVLSIGKTF